MAEFGTLNWAILLSYVFLNLILGFVLSKRVETAEDFYLGRRTTPWWAIGISVVATYVSALSFLGGCPSRLFVRFDFVAIFPSGRLASGHV